jgi:SAM-dependent methyltransferase
VLVDVPVLWKALIDEWRLAPREVDYVNRQQGFTCTACGCNLRSMVLAWAVLRCTGYRGVFKDWVDEPAAQSLRILEVNGAGNLTQFLSRARGHVLSGYPDVDIEVLPYPDASFDLVLHSETLEHVQNPVRGLAECRRVLRRGGFCVFTVPLVLDRLTARRDNLPPSYHGPEGTTTTDYLVRTEYGCDVWKQVIEAGFPECRICSLEYPAAQAVVGVA